MNAQSVTAREYLDLERRALRDVQAQAELRRIEAELANTPRIREKLVFEFLTIADKNLGNGTSPERPVLSAIRMGVSVRVENIPVYVASLEKIASRSFELMGQCKDNRFTLSLVAALVNLRQVEAAKFRLVMENLARLCRRSPTDPRREFLAAAEMSDSKRKKMLRRLLSEAERQNTDLAKLAKN